MIMGSTGHASFSSAEGFDTETFGIVNAHAFSGRIMSTNNPLEQPGSGRVTLKVKSDGPLDAMFQFKLMKDGTMKMLAYNPNTKEEARITVNGDYPSISNANLTESTSTMRRLFSIMRKSAVITDSQLSAISAELKRKKRS